VTHPDELRLQAYFDGETDAVSAAEIESHVEQCAQCGAVLQDFEQLRATIRRDLTYRHAPPDLKARILRSLDQEAVATAPRGALPPRSTWRLPSFWAGAFTGLGGAVAASILAIFLMWPSHASSLTDELVSAHVRSLMPLHLIDVVSTDQHTVKPWFAGHADVSPTVADFTQHGYRLIGGRADYFDRQRSAVTVYQHGAHVINVFTWAAAARSSPPDTTRNGYRLVFWKVQDLQYCAVSDAGWDELFELAHLLHDLSLEEVPKNTFPANRE
jgi:anti-sigma factor RsiW